MPRYRSPSYSPSSRTRTPPRGTSRHYDDEDPRDRYRSYSDRRSPLPSRLLVRNLPFDARPEDLRVPFEKYGQVKNVYLPKNYNTGESRGFGFVNFLHADDAAKAKQRMNHKIIAGRQIKIVFANNNSGRYGSGYRGRTPQRSPRRRHRSYSHSPSPARHNSRDRGSNEYYSPWRSRSVSRSRSPQDEREYRPKQRSPSPRENGQNLPNNEFQSGRSRSPGVNNHGQSRSRSRS